jgi:GNAT superfamily N-acetyltransferase
MDEITIDVLTEESLGELLALWREAELSHRPSGRDDLAALGRQMKRPDCRFLAARAPDGALLGAVLANHEGRKGWINRLAVSPRARRAGVARALVEACEAWLHGEGIDLIAALVEGDNLTSQQFFENCGYDRVDTLVYFRKARSPDV